MTSIKASLGLLLAVVVAGAFAVAGLCETVAPKRSAPRDEGLLALQPRRRFVLHDHVLEPQRDQGRLEGRLRLGGRDPTSGVLDSDLVIDGPGNNTAFGHVVLDLPTLTGVVTFSGGTGVFTHFHAGPLAVACPAFPDCSWDGPYSSARPIRNIFSGPPMPAPIVGAGRPAPERRRQTALLKRAQEPFLLPKTARNRLETAAISERLGEAGRRLTPAQPCALAVDQAA